jgi:uncharacterized protein (TIGR00106 family)
MLVELSIIPVGRDPHMSDELAEVLKIVDDSGLAYQLTPSGTCIEGGWDEVMSLVQRCHAHARQSSPHVITALTIEDDGSETEKLRRNVESLEELVGHRLGRERRSTEAADASTNDTTAMAAGVLPEK